MLKIFFCGTPQFSLPALRKLASNTDFKIELIVTQPDRPKGRGIKLQASPVKILAEELKIPVIQPENLKGLKLSEDKILSGGEVGVAASFNLYGPYDLGVVVAYGNLIPLSILNLPKVGCLNIHPSILPRWRGAAPVQRSIEAGDKKTAVSIMKLDRGLDTGEIYLSEELEILATDTAGSLSIKCAEIGAELLNQNISKILAGKLKSLPQAELGLTYANKWQVAESNINWELPAEVIANLVRASDPIPGARSSLGDNSLVKLFNPVFIESGSKDLLPGSVLELTRSEIVVRCGGGECLGFSELQFEGRKRLPIREALNGRQISVGDRFQLTSEKI